jgi:hypothetical protein
MYICNSYAIMRREIQFSSIHVYLRANLTAQKLITKFERARREKQQKTDEQNKIQIKTVYLLIMMMIIP